MQHCHYIFFGAVVVLTLLAAPAVAESPPQTEQTSDAERAQEFFDTGAQHYYEGEYGRAIVEFQKANRAHPHPLFLFNIALSNLHLQRHDRAIDAARRAEEMDQPLGAENSARNRAMIASSETVLNSGDIAEVIAGLEVDEEEADDDPAVAEPTDPEPVDEPPEVDEPPGFGPVGWAGAAGLGTGAAAMITAGVLDAQIRSDWDDLEADMARMPDDEFDREIESIERRQLTGQILLFSGVGVAVAGAALMGYELFVSPSETDGVAIGPRFDRPGIDVTMQW